MTEAKKPLFRLSILGLLIFCWWLLPTSVTESQKQAERDIDVVVSPLQVENGLIPLAVRCGPARLVTQNELDAFSCTLRNNTDKPITGASLTYSVVVNRDGSVEKYAHFLTVQAFIHTDFRDSYKSIKPGAETVVSSAKVVYQHAAISGIEITIDYIEFENGTTSGPNLNGSRLMAEMREGAAKYKDWLVREYTEKGKPMSALILEIQKKEPFTELTFSTGTQESGARAYRTLMRKRIATSGESAIENYFRR